MPPLLFIVFIAALHYRPPVLACLPCFALHHNHTRPSVPSPHLRSTTRLHLAVLFSLSRQQRNQDPRALLKDRHSRSGLTKSELMRKNGAGAHNWGAFAQEQETTALAEGDARTEQQGMFDMDGAGPEANDAVPEMGGARPRGSVSSNSTDDDVMNMGMSSTLAANKDVVATSPTDSMSSMTSAGDGASSPTAPRAMPGRRMSNVSEEEREKARSYREGVMHKGGKSTGFSQAPLVHRSFTLLQALTSLTLPKHRTALPNPRRPAASRLAP